MKYNRILLKLSGESLQGRLNYGIDPAKLDDYVNQVAPLVRAGVQVGIVIGGGNIFRGVQDDHGMISRVSGDYMGMLATVINSVALQQAFVHAGVPAVHLGALEIDPVCEKTSGERAIASLEEGRVVIISGGTGNPYFTTDTAAALRAVEIKADVLLKGTRVDGVYTADPETDPGAVRYDALSFEEAYEKKLNIMDLTAFTLCREQGLPVIVFNVNKPGALDRVMQGEAEGTRVGEAKKT